MGLPSTFTCKAAVSKALSPSPALCSFCPLELRWKTLGFLQPALNRGLMDLAKTLPPPPQPGLPSESFILVLQEAVLPTAQPPGSRSGLNLPHCSVSEWKGILGFPASF